MDSAAPRSATDLSREELHSLVWQRPLSLVGPELGLNGQRLATLCNKRRVPYPPPGYWQKKSVGRETPVTPLPPAEEAASSPVIASPKREGPKPAKVAPQTPLPQSPLEVKTVVRVLDIDAQAKGDGLDLIEKLHPKIRAWLVEHKREQKERAQENRQRRRELWVWSTPLLDDLTPRDLYRFRASSTLCHAIEKAGGCIKEADRHGKLILTVQGRDVECAVKEKLSRPIKALDRGFAKWTAYPDRHHSGLTSSGFLRAQITTWLPGGQPQWVESARKPFFRLIPLIVETALGCVPRLVEWEKQREEEHRRYQEEERRRWELRRLKEIDDKRWNQFLAAATNWREMQVLETFIKELQVRLASEGDQTVGDKTTSEWLDWARQRTADLDPFADGVVGLFQRLAQP